MVATQANRGWTARAGVARPVDAPARVGAALDLGTNNCRLLIAHSGPEGFQVVDAFSRIVRLGEGLSRTDRLSEPAMARALEALRICSSKMRRRAANSARAVATEACRRAINCQDFLSRVQRETGIRLEIISSREEGRLVVAGCAALLDPLVPHGLVFDIGGGSTEVIWLQMRPAGRPEVIDHLSIRRGVVCFTELHGMDAIPSAAYRSMVEEITAPLTAFAAKNRIGDEITRRRVQMLGTSGTVTTLVGVQLGLTRYQRCQVDGSYLGAEQARVLIRSLVGLDLVNRSRHPCIGADRADLIVAGCAILEAILDVFPVDRLRVADRGLREGILADIFAGAQGALPQVSSPQVSPQVW